MSKATTIDSRIKKYTTIDVIEQNEKGAIYVLNATTGDKKGNVLLSVPKMNGNGKDLVTVPRTFIPIDVTEECPRNQLLQSSEFRKCVGKGMLKLVTPEYAQILLSTPEAKSERQRIVNERSRNAQEAAKALSSAEVEEDEEDEYYDPNESSSSAAANKKEKKFKAETKVDIKLQQLVADSNEENLSATRILADIRRYGELTKNEIRYLAVAFKDQKRVIDFLKEAMSEAA